MDYKEKYEQAIEALRSLFAEQAIKHCDRVNIKDITNIFPELKESEDERIRKAIVWCIDTVVGVFGINIPEGLSVSKLKSWLEKQGEQILANSAKTCKIEQSPACSEEEEQTFIKSVEALEDFGKFELADWLKEHKDQFLKPQTQKK